MSGCKSAGCPNCSGVCNEVEFKHKYKDLTIKDKEKSIIATKSRDTILLKEDVTEQVKLMLELYEARGLTSSYDYKKYDEKCFIFVNDLTRDWGWDQRQWTSNSKTTEFYNIYKQIKFRYSISILREHIIFELNNLFFRLGINAKIKLENVITQNEYKEKLENFLKGQITYDEIIKFLY